MEFLKKYNFLFKFLIKILVLFGLFWAVFIFVLQPYRMTGNNMFPAVRDGDLCIFYLLEDVYVDDVVLYEAEGCLHVGRVAAYGTQTVDFPENGGYTVNGYVPFETVPYQTYGGGLQEYPLYVPEDYVFVLNDYRSDMTDSRTYGVIPKDAVRGKLLFLLRRRSF